MKSVERDLLDLDGKRLALYGFKGVTGKSVMNFLAARNKKLSLYDDSYEGESIDNYIQSDARTDKLNILDDKEKLLDHEVIITSPGVPTTQEFFRRAEAEDIEIISEIELAYNYFDRYIVAITGTNGKTTTTSMAGKLLKKGLTSREVETAGNIGRPLLEIMEKTSPDSVILAEVSSFQLAGIKNFKPEIAVLLNFSPDHLDWHRTRFHYQKSKAKVFSNQDKTGLAIIDGDSEILREMLPEDGPSVKMVSETLSGASVRIDDGLYLQKEKKYNESFISKDLIPLAGKHNLKNAAFAVLIASTLGVNISTLKKEIKDYSPPPHRLQKVQEHKNLDVIDDSKATNPHAALSALESLSGQYDNIYLIAGGQDRGSDLSDLTLKISRLTEGAVLLGETSEEMENLLLKMNFEDFKLAADMPGAVKKALSMIELEAAGNNLLLLSPGAPSWDMYDSYKQRGKKFRREVEKNITE